MRTLKAFVARSFRASDDQTVAPITKLLDSFKPLGIIWETAERAEIESVSKKVRQKIDDCDIFVAVFTRRHPIYFTEFDDGPPTAEKPLTPVAWTGPPWLFQESGYALKAGKKLLLVREKEVELPGLHGDLEYIEYDPLQPQTTWEKAHEMLSQLVAENAGIAIDQLVSGPEPKSAGQESPTDDTAVVLSPAPKQSALDECFRTLRAAADKQDFDAAANAEEEGIKVIRGGVEDIQELDWRCLCLSIRARAGDVDAVTRLHGLAAENPTQWSPLQALATIARNFGEYKAAGDLRVKAVESALANVAWRIRAANDYRTGKYWDLARTQLEQALKSEDLTLSVRADALKEMFWLLKESGDPVAAFCFGEAALQVLPIDSAFRFQLAYAYSATTGGYNEHDYTDLALVHYKLLTSQGSTNAYAVNNLGVAYNRFEAPINATEEFRAASSMGNALATANVIRQYLTAGFTEDAIAWAKKYKPDPDDDGDVTAALAAMHSARDAEKTKIEKVTENELSHRATLASFASSASLTGAEIDGDYTFPIANLKLSSHGDILVGSGETKNAATKLSHSFSAHLRNGLWRFNIESKKEGDYYAPTDASSYGLLHFSSDGKLAWVLEYRADGVIASYSISRVPPSGAIP